MIRPRGYMEVVAFADLPRSGPTSGARRADRSHGKGSRAPHRHAQRQRPRADGSGCRESPGSDVTVRAAPSVCCHTRAVARQPVWAPSAARQNADQGLPCLRADDAVDHQAVTALVRPHRSVGSRTEDAVQDEAGAVRVQ